MINIDRLPLGKPGTIVKVDGDARLTKRLSALGCIPGTIHEVVRTAPFGDPLVVSFRGFSLAIRKKDASAIFVEI